MANYIVSDTNLTAVANAIRTKGGTSAQLEFPDDFVSAIGDIQTGGGMTVEPLSVTENGTYTAPTGKAYSPVTVNVSGGGTDTLLALENNTLTSWTSTAAAVGTYLFYNKTALTSVSYPNATVVGQNAFYNCAGLKTVSLPSVTRFELSAFYGCSSLESITINPSFAGTGQGAAFRGCSSLTVFDWRYGSSIQSNQFKECTKLATVILRRANTVCALENVNAFTGTPFASNGTGGTLYVPQDLIASYQSANNWKTILGYANNQIKAIEGSIYE